MKIIITEAERILPTTRFDWICYEDGGDENLNGFGKTPQHALMQFLSNRLEDEYQADLKAQKAYDHEALLCHLEDLAKAKRRGELDV